MKCNDTCPNGNILCRWLDTCNTDYLTILWTSSNLDKKMYTKKSASHRYFDPCYMHNIGVYDRIWQNSLTFSMYYIDKDSCHRISETLPYIVHKTCGIKSTLSTVQVIVPPIGDNVWLLTCGLAFKKKNQSYLACLFPFFASFI